MKKVILPLKFSLWRHIFNCWNRSSTFVSLESNISASGINTITAHIDAEFLNTSPNETAALISWATPLLSLKPAVSHNFASIPSIGFLIFTMFGYKVWETAPEPISATGSKQSIYDIPVSSSSTSTITHPAR